MDLRQTQLTDNEPVLVRIAPAVWLAVATLAAGMAWGFWAGLSVFCLACLLIYRGL
jgi:hypothetical protein